MMQNMAMNGSWQNILNSRDIAMGMAGGAVYAGITFLGEGAADVVGAAVFTGAFIITLVVWNHMKDR